MFLLLGYPHVAETATLCCASVRSCYAWNRQMVLTFYHIHLYSVGETWNTNIELERFFLLFSTNIPLKWKWKLFRGKQFCQHPCYQRTVLSLYWYLGY